MKGFDSHQFLTTHSPLPTSHTNFKEKSLNHWIPLVPESTFKLKNISKKDLDGLQALLGPRRPMTAFYGKVDPAQLQTTQLWHRESKGLRSEDKFQKFIENVRGLRQTSETIVQKNTEAMEIMHGVPPEEPDLSEFMEKNYLRAPKRDKASQFEFTTNAKVVIQEKKFKSMRRALDEINAEKKSGRKIVKYMTNNPVDPASLAQPKFVPFESKVIQNINSASQQIDNLSIEKAMQDLANLNSPKEIYTPATLNHSDSFEYKKEQLKMLKENLNFLQKTQSARKHFGVSLIKEESSPPKTPSQKKSPVKLSSKYKSKKQGIENRIKSHKPLEDFLKVSAPEPESAGPLTLGSPKSANFATSRLSFNHSHRDKYYLASPANIFEKTEPDFTSSQLSSPLVKERNADEFISQANEETSNKNFMAQRQEKMKKMLQTSPAARHIRIPNDKIVSKEKYNTSLDSFVSPLNADKILTQSKVLFFKNHYLEPNLRTNESTVSQFLGSTENTKIKVFNSYKALSLACENSTKSTSALQNALKKNYELLDTDLAVMSNQLTEGEMAINYQIKQDIVTEMQYMSSATVKVGRKTKKNGLAASQR